MKGFQKLLYTSELFLAAFCFAAQGARCARILRVMTKHVNQMEAIRGCGLFEKVETVEAVKLFNKWKSWDEIGRRCALLNLRNLRWGSTQW